MNLSDILNNSLHESTGDSREVYEISIDLDINDPKIAKDGIIIDKKNKECYGLREALMKWVQKSYPNSSPVYLNERIKPTKKYVIKTYHCDEAKGKIEKAQKEFNQHQYNFNIIEVKPYPKLVNTSEVIVIQPKDWTAEDLTNKKIPHSRKHTWDRENQTLNDRYIKFFKDDDAGSTFKVEDLPEFKTMEKRFRDISTEKQKEKMTYQFIVDPEYVKNTVTGPRNVKLKLTIHGNGYVRVDDGGTQVQMVFPPTGDTIEEKLTAAWKYAIKWCHKKKLM